MPNPESICLVRPFRSSTRTAPRRGALRTTAALVALVVSPGLSGCILGTERPDLNLDMPVAYRAGPKSEAAADKAPPALDWWRGFRSGEL
ncbi:MAG: hypothetical protein JO141_15100, partial [Bradyrhizobium sp.]|nr:hypothetical protein [Bradyrhizobium sp.]